jgi:hypothetical protein
LSATRPAWRTQTGVAAARGRYEIAVSEEHLSDGNTVGAVRIGDVVHKRALPEVFWRRPGAAR